MRTSPLPAVAIAAMSGVLGLLGPTHDLPLSRADRARGDGADIPSDSRAPAAASRNDGIIRSSNSSSGGTSWLGRFPSPLLPLVCRADASGYDAIAAKPPAPTSMHPLPSANDIDVGADGDTITGVFHRLNPQRAKLVLVQAVFRHGARTPLSNRSNLWSGQQWDVCGKAYQAAAVHLFSTAGVENPVSKHDLSQRSVVLEGGCSKGELTLLGQSQARDLGRWLRSRYVEQYDFLPTCSSSVGVVEARTTNMSRTIATLRGVLTGLYPDLPSQVPDQQQAGLEGHALTPRVTTSADLDEILYADTRACPHLGSFQALSREAGRAAIRSDPDYEWARGELMRLLGMDATAFDAEKWIFTEMHDVLTSLAAHGKQLPPGFAEQPRLLATINRLATKEFAMVLAPSVRDAHGRTVLRLSMGRLLHIMVANMTQAMGPAAVSRQSPPTQQQQGKGAAGPLLYLYSGHDSTIMPLLSALGVDVTEWPPYLSNLVLELWELAPRVPGAPPRHVVRVLYNQEELPLPHCPPGFLPSLQTFEREVVGPFLLSDQHYEALCRVKVEHGSSMPSPKAKAATSA